MVLLTGFGAPKIGERVSSTQHVKLGFSYLSQAQVQDLCPEPLRPRIRTLIDAQHMISARDQRQRKIRPDLSR